MKLLAALLLCPAIAFGACRGSPDDRWRGDDKIEHFGMGGIVSVVAGTQTRSPMTGFLWGAGVSVGWELAQAIMKDGVCSHKDALAGIIGAGFGAGGAYVFIRLKPGGAQINAVWEIK
jgi:hypothetical protein